jgi:hypothetical protein
MTKMEETNCFCENYDCRWSVTLSRSEGEEPSRRVCGWPVKHATPPVVSTYLDFLRPDESLGKERHLLKE